MGREVSARSQAVDALLIAILACPDAEMVMETVLMARRGGSPRTAFADEAAGAALWAAGCTPAELVLHARAAFEELRHRGFSRDLRKRLAAELCAALPQQDRQWLMERIRANAQSPR